jgi:methanogenic corrinoid protein MtbC1
MTGITPQVADWGRAEDATGSPPDRASQTSFKATTGAIQADARMGRLARAISAEVIPRLVLARRSAERDTAPGTALSRAADELMPILVAEGVDAALAHLQKLRESGLGIESVYLDILAPIARRFGELWDTDRCDFGLVTVGVMRLQQVMRRLAPEFQAETPATAPGRRIVLAAMPGEQHTFGISMLAEFFRRDGWDVHDEPLESVAALTDLVREHWIGVVGLSLSGESGLDRLARAIRTIRRHSHNRSIGIMVGGAVFAGSPERVARVGADASALDPRQAVQQARDLRLLLAAVR